MAYTCEQAIFFFSFLQLLPPSFNSDKVSPSQQQLLARKRLKQLVSHKQQELQHHACIPTLAAIDLMKKQIILMCNI